MLSPGVLLGNRYRLDERIASGGMGDVWRGTDEVLGRTVAVKILLPALLNEPGFAERFRGEARTMATINHPGVVDVYDYGSDQQIAFLVMEYVEGDALSRTLSRVRRLTPSRTMALVAQAADALHAAHEKGIVHRDVKPGNLLVRPNGTLVLTDFGIARSAMVGQLTAAGSVLGTASYISPEQAAGGTATAASDVYALGVVAYQCLAGHRPFEGDNPLEIALKHVREVPRPLPGDIPPAVRAIVERAMAKDPAGRWPTAATLAAVARQAAVTLSAGPAGAAPAAGGPPAGGGTGPRTGAVPGTPTRPPPLGHRPAAPGSPAGYPSASGPLGPGGPRIVAGPGTGPIGAPGRSATPPARPGSGPSRPATAPPWPGPGGATPVSAPRPTSGGLAPGYRLRPAAGAAARGGGRGRTGLIVTVVVVGVLLVAACAGLIKVLADQSASSLRPAGPAGDRPARAGLAVGPARTGLAAGPAPAVRGVGAPGPAGGGFGLAGRNEA
ncbi:MAG TPA: protein kinase [Pilimelia sp.]|nr:protein kinase [Pilimelia sp.]